MMQQASLSFLSQIAENNNKPWFDEHKKQYTAAKSDFEQLVTGVLEGLSAHDPAFREQKAKDCIMRVNRDIRFSKDKSPYKVNLGAGFSRGGRKFPCAGYYLHIEPGNKSFVGGGVWQPEGPVLKAIRQEIDYGFADFKAIVEDKKFKKTFGTIDGERLVKTPAGYAEDNPAINYLRLKSFTVGANITDEDLLKKGLLKKINDINDQMTPFINFLNRAF